MISIMQPMGQATAQSLFGLQGGSSAQSGDNGLGSFMNSGAGNGGSNSSSIVTPQPATPAGQSPTVYSSAAAPAAVGAAGPAAPTLNAATQTTTQLLPFGASLFTTTTPPSNMAPNPNYVIQPGDTVSIQVYGGETAQSSANVDTQGNVFLPGFGPVHVAGVLAANLQQTVQKEIANAFTSNVSVYAVLQTESSISIFVTGFVKAPGQYLGSASDSVLDFLSRAGGVDPSRGSYRDIEVLRNGRILRHVDLYDFLLNGAQLPATLQDGDTILVAKQEPLVAVGGSVRNNYLFEVPDAMTAGQDVLNFSQPLPSATNVLLNGTRYGKPFSQYVSLNQLTQTPLYDQDQLTFITDVPAPTITVQVQGSRIGPSVLVANRDTTLKTLLNYIAVDPNDAATKSIYIVRPGLAAQQYDAIQAALDRLQKALFYATSATTGESQIRASEATMIQNYINAARTIQPDGILVVADANGDMNDVRLESGDIITIPQTSDTVMVDGEVQSPQAVTFSPTATRTDYINLAGGTSERGRRSNTIIRRLSGRLVLDANAPIMPGDELIVLPYVETANFVVTQDVLSLIYQVAASTYFASKL
jgi:protein involved in polysaccharide export with SLBB domain